MVMEVGAPGTELAGQGVGSRGGHRRAASALTINSYPGGAPLSERLTAVARMVQIGSARSGTDGFSAELIDDAEALLGRAGERLRLSAQHTIVVLAGGTGSGKSSLFGAGPLRDIETRTRGDLHHRIALIFDEEMRRFADVIDAVGTPDAMAGLQLYQATYALEVAR